MANRTKREMWKAIKEGFILNKRKELNSVILPAKAELLQQALVVIDKDHKQVSTNSLKVAEYFGKRPADVNRRINNLIKNSLCKIAPSKYIDDRGKEQNYYILDRKNFSIVALGFTGEKAEQFRVEYVEQFEKTIVEWLEWGQIRNAVIEPTKMANDSIEWLRLRLVEEIPTSSKPKLLFVHIQQAITKKATGNSRTDRATMTARQLKLVEWLEVQAHDEIEHLKALHLPATEIREQVLTLIKGE